MKCNFDILLPTLEKMQALTTTLDMYDWDAQTLAPKDSFDNTAKIIGVLSEEYYKTLINKNVLYNIQKLEDKKVNVSLTEKERKIVAKLRKTYNQIAIIPLKEYREYCEFSAKAVNQWSKAKTNEDFNEFAPVLKRMVEYKKKFARYRTNRKVRPYDVLLNDYEEGFTMEKIDEAFEKIKKELLPFKQKVQEACKSVDKQYNNLYYNIGKQKEFCTWLSGYLGFNFNKGVIAESEHPFTTAFHNKDVRITNHYYEHNLESAIFSAIHETGHGIYEMNVADDFTQTLVGGGASCGMHESQARFFENAIGKSGAFWKPIFPKLVKMFPEQLSELTLDEFIQGINKSYPCLIRTESDELTYTFHIIIRYELEKMLFENKLKVENLPKAWKEKYREYIGNVPMNDAEGVLQDVHWAGGDFGYFPSYAIGNMIAAQIYYYMSSIMPLDDYLKEGNILPIREFLNDKIHQYGMTKNTNEMLKEMTGEELNVDYYIKYMKDKYMKLYDVKE